MHSTSFPVEIGWCAENGEAGSVLVRPDPAWKLESWDEQAEGLHGYSLKHLMQHGLPPNQVADVLNFLLAGRIVLSDGVSFDQNWLDVLFQAAKTVQQFRVQDVYVWLGEQLSRGGGDVKRALARLGELNDAAERPHRAADDARLICRILKEILSTDQ